MCQNLSSISGQVHLTGALLDRISHYINIFGMNGDSFAFLKADPKSPADTRAKSPAPQGENSGLAALFHYCYRYQ
ncbi:hypothetical protein ACFQ3K_09570 [Brucella gallinifaecis]|uniref:Uncharacterized protein n=1 Tax=Brucella gallinifaecis TaxID=215590 RepID=A0A502BRD7_9HYPH|nr:hypothetical protein [Brucella gallinifaecis]TPF76815.1 hypothetical protein FHY56_00095 [Brucella gallinifaecis]